MDLLMNKKSLDTQHSRSMIIHLTIQWNIMPMNTWMVKRDMIMQWLSFCQMMVPLPHLLQSFWGLCGIVTSHWVFLHPNLQVRKSYHQIPYNKTWRLTTTNMWWSIQHQIMCQVNNWKGNLCHGLSLEMLWTVCTLSRLKQFMDHCLSLRIMVLVETMLPNYSVPCHEGNGGNTLATRYNHKIILVDDAYWLISYSLNIISPCYLQ